MPLNPARLLDTRDGTGGNISALASQALTELKVTGVGGVPPTGATAVVLNVTVDAPLTSGFITAWPSGEGQPTVSNLNYVAGQTVPNLVTVKVGANGRVNLYNSEGYTHLVADVVGYYTAASATTSCPGRFTAVTPKRLLDTRQGAGTPVGAGQAINLTVTGGATTVPAGASGVALNVTVDQPSSAGYLTVWPTGEAAAAGVEPQLRARADDRQPRARQGRHRWPGQHLQLGRRHACRRRCRRLLLDRRRNLRSGEPAANRRQSLRCRGRSRRSAGPG